MNECVINCRAHDKIGSHELPGALIPIHDYPLVVAVAAVVVVVVKPRSLMLAHGWMAVPNVVRAACDRGNW